ncbi:hypothetical protein [Corynebacterium sanguinis]|uniref:hypothetical protein n=1 Tax=Corynebacterium sanguinis TaxID=2594913 RepID=UPI00223C2095|nr:hypothetical protein [Corynebacterium sanguinis]MCT1694730.1 hypothetical protein [Corynebacterium sanguinis]MCT1714101.1 hypothetical protein [Corynebacterium sanguinis]MCT1804406.1 hypothetical protein [Corynebacterium sanguinis]MCT2157773.1 hypothetical protein [Corynebacterium sanguinis]
MRRLSTSLAAGFLSAATVVSVSPAHAQTANVVEIAKLVNGGIATADCGAVSTGLKSTGFVGPETTRGELVASLTKAVGDDATLRLVSASTINTIGDRALECGVVKPDPVTPLNQAIAFASQLSSQAGLPELRNVLPALQL